MSAGQAEGIWERMMNTQYYHQTRSFGPGQGTGDRRLGANHGWQASSTIDINTVIKTNA